MYGGLDDTRVPYEYQLMNIPYNTLQCNNRFILPLSGWLSLTL